MYHQYMITISLMAVFISDALQNDTLMVKKPFLCNDHETHQYEIFDPLTGKRSHQHYNDMLKIISMQKNATENSKITPQVTQHVYTDAFSNFSQCLQDNYHQLKVKDLKDIYRIRGIPTWCCSSLADLILPIELMDLFGDNGATNCRINSFFSPNGGFDPHTHPLYFVSIIVSGAYTHSYFSKESEIVNTNECLPCDAMFDEICTEQNRIYRQNADLPLEYHGTIKLQKEYEEIFNTGDIILFDSNDAIHIIEDYLLDTVTVNWVSIFGDDEIDVFTSHETPFRTVLTKPDTKNAMKGSLAAAIIDKTIGFF